MHTYIHTSIYFIYIWLDMHISRWSIMNPTARSSTAQGEAQEGQGFGAFGAGGCLPDMACPKRSSGTRGNRRKQSHCARVPRAGGSRRSAPYSENLRNASIAVQNRRCRRLKNQIWKSNGGSDCPHRIHKLVWMCQTYSNIFCFGWISKWPFISYLSTLHINCAFHSSPLALFCKQWQAAQLMALWLADCDSLDSDILCDCRSRPNKKRKREGQTQAAEVADLTRVIRVIKSLRSRKLFHIESMAWWACDQLMSKPIQTVLNRKRGFAAALRFEQALAEPVVETEVQEEAEAPAEVAEVSVNKKSKKPKKDSKIGYRFL